MLWSVFFVLGIFAVAQATDTDQKRQQLETQAKDFVSIFLRLNSQTGKDPLDMYCLSSPQSVRGSPLGIVSYSTNYRAHAFSLNDVELTVNISSTLADGNAVNGDWGFYVKKGVATEQQPYGMCISLVFPR